MMRKRLLFCFAACLVLLVESWGQVRQPAGWQSSRVYITEEGELVYVPDERGNTIPDFSRVGYHHGDRPIPLVTSVTKVVEPLEGMDCRQMIQDAIDEVGRLKPDETGHRGTILLKRGIYRVHGTIHVRQGGIVLMGEGDNVNETRLVAVGKERFPLIHVSGTGKLREIPGTRTRITDTFVPVGAFSFEVADAGKFKPGDKVVVFRPGTKRWIADLQMDSITPGPGTRQWGDKEYNLLYERKIVKVDGKRVYIDNPIVMQMEDKYGGGEVYKYTFDGRICEVGITNMCLESEFVHGKDNEHGWIGVLFEGVENCWARNLTCRYFAYAGVSCGSTAKNVTVADCRCLEAKSVVTGGLRYSFNNNGQQNLFMNCHATEGRHDFVTGARVCGPNVFYNCTAFRTHADTGPHHRWASGTLYDNIVTDGVIAVQDRGNWGTGHGWAGVTQVIWNCQAQGAVVQSPWVSGDNYSIGFRGQKFRGRLPGRPDGYWEGQNLKNLFPRSLYLAQLMARYKGLDLRVLLK